MGDKSAAKSAMRAAGVPLVPGSLDRLAGPEEAVALAADVGYPVLLKAVAGGGGRGMRVVESQEGLADAYRLASAEAASAFGDGDMYLEKAIVDPRHVEMQVLADGTGGVLVLGERDCSVQRRHQKLIEEGPSPALDQPTREAMADAARLACVGSGYENAGTVEFLLDAEGRFSFIEMNTRLQVEHPVSELLTGVDLAVEQLRIAAGRAAAGHRAGRAARACDRVSHQLRGSPPRLPPGRRNGQPVSTAAGPGRAVGHPRLRGIQGAAVL